MREVLNVDSILSSDGDHHLPIQGQMVSGQKKIPYEQKTSWSPREDAKPKSLMTIYEDEQRHELGNRSSPESESRDRERTKGTVNHFTLKKENWKNQRMESGYESCDRISNGSATLDFPVVENIGTKELRRVPEVRVLRDPDYQRRYEDTKTDGSQRLSYGEMHGKTHELIPRQNKRGPWDRVDEVNGSTGPAFLSKMSSSEWNSSDDLSGPVSEQEDTLSQSDVPPLIPHHPSLRPSHTSVPPLPPKPHVQRYEYRRGLTQDFAHLSPKVPAYQEVAVSKMSSEIWLENSGTHTFSSSGSSSKSVSSNNERNDLSTSESEDKCPSIPDCSTISNVAGEHTIPTTYFSVDSCMTDTYRAKYHKKRSALHSDSKTGEYTSSSESDHGERFSPAPADLKIPVSPRTKKETAYTSSKPIVKWNPVSVKGLDEHGFL
ncbi:hypothetical protein HF521_019675 [Silurus meridionalis]|uniref:Uncharacterized protein n=2 Tax=Silurus meridionalis TaxID=175797 RepID=A0A8T0BGX4_SILME|nr:hypothetical protein HF521_019675 [Silurus meridionalis]